MLDQKTSIRSKYTVLQEIGSGGFARTYKVQEISTNTIYCLKEMTLPFLIILFLLLLLLFRGTFTPEQRKMHNLMIQEAPLLQTLQSTHVILFHEYDIENSKVYIVMEYAPNGTLKEKISVFLLSFIHLLSL